VAAQLFHADRQTGRPDEANSVGVNRKANSELAAAWQSAFFPFQDNN